MDLIEGNLLEQIMCKGPAFMGRIHDRLSDIRTPMLGGRFSDDLGDLFVRAEKKCESLNGDSLFLFRVRAVCEALVFKESGWIEWQHMQNLVQSITGLPGQVAIDSCWTFVPCLFATKTDSYVRFLFCGMLKNVNSVKPGVHVPDWAEPCMDGEFHTSIADAYALSFNETSYASLNRRFSICCFPLSVKTRAPVFNGNSAGLPIYLGIRRLLERKTYPQNLAATGVISAGNVDRVAFIEEKKACAIPSHFDYFLYPSGNTLNSRENAHDRVCFQVKDLDQAYVLVELVASDHDLDVVGSIHQCLETPESFAAFCCRLPEQGFGLIKDRLGGLALKIVETPDLLHMFLRNFRKIADQAKYNTADHISSVFDPVINDHLSVDPVSRAEWLLINLDMSNHRGHVGHAEALARSARTVMKTAVTKPQGRDLLKWLSNFEFVHRRHNQYMFKPEMPEGLDELIDQAEKSFAWDTKGIEGASDPLLGAIYGTLAQNYGFCGPQYIDKTIEFSKKSIEKFGGEHVQQILPADRKNCLRPYNYMAYAYLDAEDYALAERCLLKYLDQASIHDVMQSADQLSEWEHALLTRYMADAADLELIQTYFRFYGENDYGLIKNKHPWQLWCYNMARCALKVDEKELAAWLSTKSVEICEMTSAGPTLRVMALLPLTFLFERNLMEEQELEGKYHDVVKTALALNSEHFSDLQNITVKEGLVKIGREPGRYFPFSYR